MLLLDETPYEEPKEILQVAPTGIPKAAGMAALKFPVGVAGAGLLIAGGLDELIFGRDEFFKLYDEEIKPIQDRLTPEPGSVSEAGRFISGIAGFAPALLLGPAGIPILAGSGAINTGADLVEQGVSAGTATGAAVLTGAAGVAMAGIPAAGKTWSKTLALAAANPVIGAATTQAEKSLLEAGGYGEIAKSYDPLDPVGRGIDAVMGIVFGAMGKYALARKEMLTKTKDSLDTVGNWQRMFKDTPFDTTDPKTADLGYKAMQKALSDIAQGRPVDLSGVVPDVVKLKAGDGGQGSGVRAEEAEAKAAIAAAERAYKSLDAPTPRDIAIEEAGQELSGKLAAEHVKIVGESRNIMNTGMPGWHDPKYYKAYIEKLWDWHAETEIPVSRADLDIGHVKGMNETLGHFETDKHLRKISELIKSTVEGHGIKDATFSRYGGDELAIEAVGVPKDVLDKAVQDAKIKVDQYARDNKLLGLTATAKNADGTKTPIVKDVTLHINTADFSQFKSYEEMRKANDAKMVVAETITRGAQHELRVEAGTAGAAAPEGRSAGGARRGPGDLGQDRSVGQAPEVTEVTEVIPARKPKEVLPLSESKRLSLETVKKYLERGEAATRMQTDYAEAKARGEMPSGPWKKYEPNPFPDYFKGKGYKKKETVSWITKALAGEPLTEKQRSVVEDLMAEHRSKIANQFMTARAEMQGYGDLWNDPAVQSVEQRIAEEGDFPVHVGTDFEGKPTSVTVQEYLAKAKAEYKALEGQRDIYERISDCL